MARHLGEIDLELQSRINGLSAATLDELSQDLLDFTQVAELASWLELHSA